MNVTLINLVFVYIAWQIKFVSRGSVLLTILSSPFFFYYLRSNFGRAFYNISIKLKPSLHPAPIPVHFKANRHYWLCQRQVKERPASATAWDMAIRGGHRHPALLAWPGLSPGVTGESLCG